MIRDGKVRTIIGKARADRGGDRPSSSSIGTGAESSAGERRRPRRKPARELFRVANWSHADEFDATSTSTVRSGEIVALMGVEGSGARELLRSFAGLERCTGAIRIDGARGRRRSTATRAYVPGDPRSSASTRNFSVGENLVVRLGVPEIAGAAAGAPEAADARARRGRGARASWSRRGR